MEPKNARDCFPLLNAFLILIICNFYFSCIFIMDSMAERPKVISGNHVESQAKLKTEVMKRATFIRFCEDLKSQTNMKASRYLTVQEKVSIFSLIISHNESNSIVVENFQHSCHTISLAFNLVLRKVCKFGVEIISLPNMGTVPMKIVSISKYYPFFKDCISAIDSTHVAASIPQNEQISFCARKTNTTWNITSILSCR
uniref:DUF8040 domain-containing protein n=1 Tax=Cucumis melo TaxID=3656 RepID=A0A9I9ED23_CUCME